MPIPPIETNNVGGGRAEGDFEALSDRPHRLPLQTQMVNAFFQVERESADHDGARTRFIGLAHVHAPST